MTTNGRLHEAQITHMGDFAAKQNLVQDRVGPPVGEPICDRGVWPLPVILV
jgi:hypothetical protein